MQRRPRGADPPPCEEPGMLRRRSRNDGCLVLVGLLSGSQAFKASEGAARIDGRDSAGRLGLWKAIPTVPADKRRLCRQRRVCRSSPKEPPEENGNTWLELEMSRDGASADHLNQSQPLLSALSNKPPCPEEFPGQQQRPTDLHPDLQNPPPHPQPATVQPPSH